MKRASLILMALTLAAGLSFAGTKTTVNFWFLWGDAKEVARVQAMVSQFNASQNDYEVKGLSTPDVQKIKVGIASGEGPDIADDYSDAVAAYAANGVAEPLDGYISQSRFPLTDFIPSALETCKYQGKLYALPISLNMFMLFYNKDLLAAAGFKNPPRTDKELLDMATKLTKANADGSLKVEGFPDFPHVYYQQPMTVAFGGTFANKDGSLAPDSTGTRLALQTIATYRKQFGVTNVTTFESSSGYLTESDPFMNGQQAFRIDGPWFGKIAREDLKRTRLNYGVAPLPYPDGHPELSGSNLVRASIFYIAANARNKQGAWAFTSWLHQEKQMSVFDSQMGNFPARLSSLDSPLFRTAYDFGAFADMAKSRNLRTFPSVPTQAEYIKILSDAGDSVMLLKATPADALQAATQQTAKLSDD